MKKLFAIVISMAMIVAMMPSMAFATGVTPDYEWYGDGTATEYTISTEQELLGFANIVNGAAGGGNPSKDSFGGKTVKLGADITLTSENWTPIGAGVRSGSTYKEGSSPFEGTFNGNNKTISGLKITSGSGDSAIGLFGIVKGGTIKNLKLEGVNIDVKGDELAGGAAGFLAEDGTVEGVTVSGSISAKKGVGGVVGRVAISGTISDCVNSAAVSAVSSNAGGIVGAAYYTAENEEMKISNCVNKGNITGGNVCIGGIAGLSAANISDCKNEGEIKGTNSTDTFINSVGGIVGGYQSYGSVTGCTNVANVSINAKNASAGAGGIVGWIMYSGAGSDYARSAAVEVKNNINKGSVESSGSSAGGIVGHVQYMAVVTGNKNYAETISSNNFAAGIVGSVQEYADNEVKSSYNAKKGLNVDISDNLTTTKIETQPNKHFTNVVWNNVSASERTDVTYTEERNIAGKVKEGDTGYWSLAEAVKEVADNKTITLLDNLTVPSTVELDRDVTIDLNGKTITGENCRALHVKAGKLELTGAGAVTSTGSLGINSSVIRVGNNEDFTKTSETSAELVVRENVVIEAPASYGISAFGGDTTEAVTIYGKVKATGYAENDPTGGCAVSTYGTDSKTPATIYIKDGAVISAEKTNAIYLPAGTLEIEGGTITGSTGIYFKSTNMTISGGTITGTGEKNDYQYCDNGGYSTGEAVTIDSCNYPGRVGEVTITGGYFESKNAKAIGSYSSKGGELQTGFIEGGTFSTDPSAYVKENGTNYFVKRAGEEGNYTYTVLAKGYLTTGVYLTDPSSALTGRYYISDTNGDKGPWTVSYRSGGGSSSSTTTTTTTDSVTNTTEDKTTGTGSTSATTTVKKTIATVKTETKAEADGTKTVAAAVDNTTAALIVEKAVENKSEEVVVDTTATTAQAVTETAAGTKTEIALPEQTVKEIASETEAAVTIKSDAAEVKLDAEAVKAVADQSGDLGTVSLVVETVAQSESKVEVDLKLVTSKGSVTEFKGGSVSVTVKLNTALAAKPVVCVYIDDFGTYHKVSGQKNADGTYTFVTGHFSSYAVMAEDEAEKVIAEQTENVEKLVGDLVLTARSAKTAKGSIKVTLAVDEDAIKQIEGLGYTVKYKFYRSTKKSASYKAKYEKTGLTYTNTAGTRGTRYYYKARVMVYDAQGALVAKTELKQCQYACRTK